MRIIFLLLTLFSLFYIISCDAQKYNKIIFVEQFDRVQNNMIELDSLINAVNSECDAEYSISFDKSYVEFKNNKINNKFEKGFFCQHAKVSSVEFNKIINIMKKNNIYCVYRDYSGVNVFGYRNSSSTDGSLLREIVIDEGENKERATLTRKILDNKGKLILLSPK